MKFQNYDKNLSCKETKGQTGMGRKLLKAAKNIK